MAARPNLPGKERTFVITSWCEFTQLNDFKPCISNWITNNFIIYKKYIISSCERHWKEHTIIKIINIYTSPVNNSQPVKEALLPLTLMSWMAWGMNRKKIVNSSITMLSKNNQRSNTKYERTPDPNIPVERNHSTY